MASIVSESNTSENWNNWPTAKGFDPEYEQRTPVELTVTGHIPAYAAGTLYRTGPGKSEIETEAGELFKLTHWFDGLSQTHRFQIISDDDSQTRVLYNSRFSTDDMLEAIQKTGRFPSHGFGQNRDPCKETFKKVETEFVPRQSLSSANVGVTLSVNMPGFKGPSGEEGSSTERWTDSKGIENLWAKTDFNAFKKLDPETLEPIGMATQESLHPDLIGQRSGAHARSDPVTGDVFNYNLVVGPTSIYRIFHVSASTGKTVILAEFPGLPSYIHSLLLTEDFVVLAVWNAFLDLEKMEDKTASFIDAMIRNDPNQPATWYVVDRKHGRGLVATYESPAFFCFHTVNAYQEVSKEDPTKIDIVADLIRMDGCEFLDLFLYENMKSTTAAAKALADGRQDKDFSTFTRYRLPSIPESSSEPLNAVVEWSSCKELSPELPTLNPKFVTHKYRYTYGVAIGAESTFTTAIFKFDVENQEVLKWAVHGHSPSEPIFVRNPSGVEEDDGVLLSVILDGFKDRSYLLCLDARDLNELGRAEMDGVVGFGFHGQHVPFAGLPTGDY
ncbi:Carotenoid oxygenase [Penicillium herquei]|nr:Carotenoid oxygenase [Penicillium herquei]